MAEKELPRERLRLLLRVLPLAVEFAAYDGETVAEAMVRYGRDLGITREEAEQAASLTPQQMADRLTDAPRQVASEN